MHCPQKLRSIGGPQGSIMSVKTVPSRTHEPNLRVISWQWRPIQPIYVFQIKIDLILFRCGLLLVVAQVRTSTNSLNKK